MTDYTTMIGTGAGSIASWLNHNAISTAAPTIIAEAESTIYRRLRHFKMVTSAVGTLGSSSANVTLPADYLEDKFFMFTGTAQGRITRKPLQEVLGNYAYDGSGNRVQQKPQIFFNDQSNLVFDSPSDAAYPYLLYYYQQPAALNATNSTNFLTNTYPRLMRAATCAAASEFMKDSGAGNYDRTYWVQMTEAEIAEAQRESDRSEHTLEAGMILT